MKVFKHFVDELIDYWKGYPGFVVGNGMSKTLIDINKLKDHGPILACNLAWRHHHVDYLGHRDSKVKGACLEGFNGIHILPSAKYGELWLSALTKKLESIYYYEYGKEAQSPAGRKMYLSQTGLTMMQLAYLMGCNPIVIIGMDGCAIGGASNTFSEDKKNLTITAKGYKTSPHLLKFARKTEKFCKRLRDEFKRQVFKIGDWGLVDVPVIQPEEFNCQRVE